MLDRPGHARPGLPAPAADPHLQADGPSAGHPAKRRGTGRPGPAKGLRPGTGPRGLPTTGTGQARRNPETSRITAAGTTGRMRALRAPASQQSQDRTPHAAMTAGPRGRIGRSVRTGEMQPVTDRRGLPSAGTAGAGRIRKPERPAEVVRTGRTHALRAVNEQTRVPRALKAAGRGMQASHGEAGPRKARG